MQDLVAHSWQDYELIDSGNGQRLERFGPYTVVRTDSNVLWQPTQPDHPAWSEPDAHFYGKEKGHEWQLASQDLLEGWPLTWGKMTLKVRPTPFRHMGVFPEQVVHWEWLQKTIKGAEEPKTVLNLFGYTGASTIVAAQAGAHVTHVDASKGTVFWASENARLSKVATDKVRWIVDDAIKFMKREVRRGAKYDLIIMDPPVFGRGPKGEVWRLDEQFIDLMSLSAQLLTPKPLGVLINCYATEIYPQSFARLANMFLKKKTGELTVSSLLIEETSGKNQLPTGFSIRS
jgi:23S rRNA (cytosine1962-C5)-methyltransferase